MDKNELYEIDIEDMSEDGMGIGHVQGMAVFVKDSVVGDKAEIRIVKVKKSYAYGRVERIVEKSPFRINPVCPVARSCGGCTLQHISYEKELELKRDRVLSCLERIGGIKAPENFLEGTFGMGLEISENEPISNHIGQSINDECFRYRNKMQFPVGTDRTGNVITGFYAGRTHSIIPVDDCVIGSPVNKNITDAVKTWMKTFSVKAYSEETGKGLIRHILTRAGFKTGELMVCLVVNGNKIPGTDELVRLLKAAVNLNFSLESVVMNINKERTNKILGDKTTLIYGREYITDYLGDIRFQISANSFYQVNPIQTEKLYSKALEYAGLSGGEKVWDMYCGIGTISLFLSQKAEKVFGVEIVPQAIEDAKRNAEINGITNAEFFVGKAEEVVDRLYNSSVSEKNKNSEKNEKTNEENKYHADVVVVDPPRKGCDEKLLETIHKMNPKRMVYVSCNPATLARDLKIMDEYGYRLEKFSIYDQFSRGMHVEVCCLLEQK